MIAETARLLRAERQKSRGTRIPLLVALGPLGVLLLELFNFQLRYDWLFRPEFNPWDVIFENVLALMIPALLLGITLLCSLLLGLEHGGRMWKQLLALPISRPGLYLAKGLRIAGLLFLAATLTGLGALGLGLWYGFGDIPWTELLHFTYGPFAAALPVLALQLFASSVFSNQALPIALGVLGCVFSTATMLPNALPWLWPLHAYATNFTAYSLAGVGVGLFGLLLGAWLFSRREAK